jgi:hypothetical protein
METAPALSDSIDDEDLTPEGSPLAPQNPFAFLVEQMTGYERQLAPIEELTNIRKPFGPDVIEGQDVFSSKQYSAKTTTTNFQTPTTDNNGTIIFKADTSTVVDPD